MEMDDRDKRMMEEFRRMMETMKDEMKADMKSELDIKFANVDKSLSEMNGKLSTIDERFNRVDESINNLRSELHGTIQSEIESVKTDINARIDQNKSDGDEQIVQLSKAISDVASKVDKTLGKEFGNMIRQQVRPMFVSVFEEEERVRQVLTDLEGTIADMNKYPLATQRDLHVYFRALEEDIQEVRAQNLEMNAEVERLGGNLDHGIADVTARIDNIEDGRAVIPPAPPPPPVPVPATPAIVQPQAPVEEIHVDDDLNFGDMTLKEFVKLRKLAGEVFSTKKSKAKKGTPKGKKKPAKAIDEEGSGDGSDDNSEDVVSVGNGSDKGSEESDTGSKRNTRSKKDKSPVLNPDRFKPGGRRTSILGYEDMRRPMGDWYSRDPTSPYFCIQPPPDTKDLFLDKIRIDTVLAFCKKFNAESARYVGGLKVSNYLSETARTQLKRVAIEHNLPGQDGIIHGGIQTVRNDEIFDLLSIMCAPHNREAMQYELFNSCFPKSNYDYSDGPSTIKNITEFKHDLLIYIDRFEDKLKLLGGTPKGEKYMPTTLFKKGGVTGNPGFADYFIQGLPKPEFGWNVWGHVDAGAQGSCKDWDTFVKLFMKAVESIERRERDKNINRSIAVGVKELAKADRAQRVALKQAREAKKPHRLQAIPMQSLETVVSEGSDNGELPLSDLDEEMPSEIKKYDEDQDDEDNELPGIEEIYDSELQLLAKENLVCYEMANTGKCTRKDCKYSHLPADIERFKKAKALKLQQVKKPDQKQVSFSKQAVSAPTPKRG